MLYLGIDPGKRGAVAVLDDSQVVGVYDCPLVNGEQDLPGVGRLVAGLVAGRPAQAVIELVTTHPADGRVGAFRFGANYGAWQAACGAAGAAVALVRPQQWRKAVIGRMLGADTKQASVRAASILIRDAQTHIGRRHDRAEALLLAEYARRWNRLLFPQEDRSHGKPTQPQVAARRTQRPEQAQ